MCKENDLVGLISAESLQAQPFFLCNTELKVILTAE